MKLSIVSTLYLSADSIAEFHRRAMRAAEAIADEIEMILVNDGSPDDSLARALALQAADRRIVVLDLARNFGHHRAMMTGLAHADGDLVFLIDSDLEEPPELLGRFHAELAAGDWDVVFGVQSSRRGGWFERVSGAAFFRLMDVLSDQKLPRNVVTARLMRRDYVQALVAHEDRETQISHLWVQTGFHQTALTIEKLSLSPSTYSFGRKLEMAVKQITTTSTRLLYYVLYFGASISILSALAIVYLLGQYLFHGIGVNGYTSLIVSIWFFGGITVLILGIIGIYIANVLGEVKRRPYTHLRALYRVPRAGRRHSGRFGAVVSGPPDPAIIDAVAAYYSGKLAEHGPSPRGVDWNDQASQHLRHRQFLRLLADDPEASVLDVGCGYGDLLPFLRDAGFRGRYLGCDVAAPMVEAARRLHGESPGHGFVVGGPPAAAADYALASGTLNVMRGATPAAWEAYVAASLSALAGAGRRGFGFNMLSLDSDPGRRRPDLHYADPPATLARCIAQFGRHVALLQDYGLWEFTVLIRHPSSRTASPNPVAP